MGGVSMRGVIVAFAVGMALVPFLVVAGLVWFFLGLRRGKLRFIDRVPQFHLVDLFKIDGFFS